MSEHQYAMVMDLNKCIGCQTCTMACKKQWTDGDGMDYMYWNNVETHPGVGYPRAWHTIGGGFDEQRHLRPSVLPSKEDYGVAYEYDYAQRLFGGSEKPVMPHKQLSYGPNWDEDIGGWDQDNPYFFYLPRICNHCTHPACLEACPKKAIYKRDEDGIVLINQEACEGYRYCIKACPYKKIYFNEVTQKSEKCIFCYPRLEQGKVNACAAQCPGRIRFVGLLDDPESPVYKLVHQHKVALGLFPEKGTHPNVYYVPPFNPPKEGQAAGSILQDPRLPLDYLIYLFGPEVVRVIHFLEEELARAQNGEKSEVLQLLIGRDESVRYRIVPDVIRAAAAPEIQAATDPSKPGRPALTLMGTKTALLPMPPTHVQEDDGPFIPPIAKIAAASTLIPAAVRLAFGMDEGAGDPLAMAALACSEPDQLVESGCGSCALMAHCGSASGSHPPSASHAEGDSPWF